MFVSERPLNSVIAAMIWIKLGINVNIYTMNLILKFSEYHES